jgi:branched-chain amino acid transport system substrate-binding protein
MRSAIVGLAALTAAVGAMSSAPVSPASAQQTIKVGLILPYSGQFADPGAQADNGIKLYMQQHGDTVAGKKIEVIRKDTGGIAPDVAKRLAQELVVRDKVDILAGFSLTPNALAAADVSAQAKKFMVVMNAAASIVTTKSPYMARVSFTLPQLNEPLGIWAYKNGVRKVYSMVADFAAGHDAEAAFHGAFKAAGGEIIGAVRYPVANPDFSAFVQRAKDMNPEAIFIFVPGGAQSPAIAKALADRGGDPAQTKVMAQLELTDEQALKNMGDSALGIITSAHYDYNHASARNKEFVTAFNAAFKRNPDFFAVGGYDGMHLIYETLKKTNANTDGDALVGAAKGMAWESPRGPISIDPATRDIVQTIYMRRVEKVGGQLINVEFDKMENVKDPVKARASN